MKRSLILIVLFIVVQLIGWGQEVNKDAFRTDTVGKKKKLQIIGLPVVFYTPETQFGFGGGIRG